jgi:hypothetical protein
MINPTKLEAKSKKQYDRYFAGNKFYFAILVGNGYAQRARRTFKRASEAQAYADRLLMVWRRVYPLFVAWSAESGPEAVATSVADVPATVQTTVEA